MTISALGNYLRKMKTFIHKRLAQKLHSNNQKWKRLKMFINQSLDKATVAQLYKWNTQPWEGASYWYVWVMLKSLGWGRKAWHGRLHTVLLHLENSWTRTGASIETKRSVLASAWEQSFTARSTREIWGWWRRHFLSWLG